MKKLTQVAIDLLDFEAVMNLAEKVSPYIDIIEIGTPCIKYNGIKMLHALRKRFPNNKILVDLKTMDAGEYEAHPFYEAGADICTVLGASDLSTIAGVIKAANKFGKECQVDLINVPGKEQLAREISLRGGHILGIHTGLDQQASGQSPFVDLGKIKKLGLNMKISVAGGLNVTTIPKALDLGADIVVVGAALYGASDPVSVAREISSEVSMQIAAA